MADFVYQNKSETVMPYFAFKALNFEKLMKSLAKAEKKPVLSRRDRRIRNSTLNKDGSPKV